MREIDFIEKFLRQSWDYVNEKYRDKNLVTITSKGDPADLLTEVDLTVQKRFIETLRGQFPEDEVVAEEGEYARVPRNPAARAWVIDPIDGTYNFVRGLNPVFGVSIAFVEDGTARAAGVAFPVTGQLFLAEQGAGSFFNGRRIRVSDVQHIGEACVEIDFSTMEDRRMFLKNAAAVMGQVGQIRCIGAAVGGICQVATGDADGYLHMTLHPWDYAAAQLIAEEAGAVSSRLDGSPLRVFDGKKGVLITNGAIHEAMLAMIETA